MGPLDIKCLFLVSLCWLSRINCFKLERIGENRPAKDLQIDIYTNYDTREFLESFRKENELIWPEPEEFSTGKPPIDATEPPPPLDHWSVIWYIASFGGLILFFLIVSCSEWCCRRAARSSTCQRSSAFSPMSAENDTPPPSYEQFAPPSYDSICLGKSSKEKCEFDVYVVPVHALGSLIPANEDAPPSYVTAARQDFEQQRV